MSHDASAREALLRLGASSAEAVAQALERLASATVQRGEVSVLAEDASWLTGSSLPAIAVAAGYVEGPAGANALVTDGAGARALLTAAGSAAETAPPEPEELVENELSALAEVAGSILAAAVNGVSLVLGHELESAEPEVRSLAGTAEAEAFLGASALRVATLFTVDGHSYRLIQLVPREFADRLIVPRDDQAQAGADLTAAAGEGGVGLADTISDIRLRVWAEIGRTQIPLGRAMAIPPGAVVELDRGADEPVDVFVNGLLFGRGSLVTTDDGEWAVRLQSLETAGAQNDTAAMARQALRDAAAQAGASSPAASGG